MAYFIVSIISNVMINTDDKLKTKSQYHFYGGDEDFDIGLDDDYDWDPLGESTFGDTF